MLISFYFFAISFKQQPFEKPTLNRIKAFSEFQIFAILAVCVIIQAASAGADFDSEEALTMDDYGMLLTYLTLAFLPITVRRLPPHVIVPLVLFWQPGRYKMVFSEGLDAIVAGHATARAADGSDMASPVPIVVTPRARTRPVLF